MNRIAHGALLVTVFGTAAWISHSLAAGPVEPREVVDPASVRGESLMAAPSATEGAEPTAVDEPDTGTIGDVDGTDSNSEGVVKAPGPRPLEDGSGTAEKPLAVTFTELSAWDLDPNDIQVPSTIKAWEGLVIDIVGYMIPYGNPDHVEEFILVNDLGSCCFGQTPLPHHQIECAFAMGDSTAYVAGPVRVRGTFRIEENRQGKYLMSVFAMDVTDCVEVR